MNLTAKAATVAGALVAGLVLVPAAPATAWGLTEASTLAPAGSAVTVSTDGAGNAAAAWLAGGQVQVAERPATTHAWTPAVTVSAAGETASAPDVSVGPGGDVAVVWSANGEVKVALRPSGGAWVPARNVSDSVTWSDGDARVDVGAAGVATIVWAANNGTSCAIRSKTASATAISSQDVLLPQTAGTCSGVASSRGAGGDSVAAWKHTDGAGERVQAARRPAGAAWTTSPVLDTRPSIADAPSVAVDGAGNATIGWGSGATADTNLPSYAPWPRTSATPGAAVLISGSPGRHLQLAQGSTGPVSAVWATSSGPVHTDLGAAPEALGTGPVGAVSVARSGTGAVTVAYAVPGGSAVLAHRPSGQGWTATPLGTAAGVAPPVAAHGAEATTAWADGDGGAVRARTLDTGAPTAVHMTAPMRVLNDGLTIKAGWIGADTWLPITYEVERRLGTPTSALGTASTWLATTATDAAYRAKPGQTVCLRVRGSDTAGNVGPWSVSRCATVPFNDTALKARRASGREVWVRKDGKAGKGSFEGDFLLSSARGATLVLPVEARRIALLVGTGKGYGSVTVSLGRRKLGTFSLASARRQTQVVVPVATFSSARSGRVKVTVASRGKPVRIDGIYAGPV